MTPSKASGENHLSIGDEIVHAVLPCARCESPAPAEGLRATWFGDGSGRTHAICASCSDTWNSRRPHMRDAQTFLDELKAGKAEPAFDTDIRVGDVVEVVSHDEEAMLKSGWVGTAQAVGSRAVVRSTCCSSLGMKQTFCLFEPGDLRGAHGRFRVIERERKAYGRPEDRALGVLLDAADRVGAVETASRYKSAGTEAANSGKSWTIAGTFVEEKRDTLPAPAIDPDPLTCPWCNAAVAVGQGHTLGATTHPKCGPYWYRLQERVSAGAYDIPEERESVRRFVDAQAAPPPCRHCGKPNATTVIGAGSGKIKDVTCRACALSRERKKRGEVAAPEIDPVAGWSAGSTATWEWP
jgi:hypothetical protein